MKVTRLVLMICALATACFSIDRDAFTFTNYNLDVSIEPEQHRLAVRGKMSLRNDSAVPQKNVSLQISSSLDWRSIQAAGKPVQFVSQPYVSDIDHTGSVSEAIVTLPQAVPPKNTVDLDIGYEGVVLLDTTRLKQMGVPDDVARHTDWDQISPSFTALRGVGYVVWYPVAMQSADLSDGNSLFEVLGKWKARERQSDIRIKITSVVSQSENNLQIFCNAEGDRGTTKGGTNEVPWADCSFAPLGLRIPAFVIQNFDVLEGPALRVYYLSENKDEAEMYVDTAKKMAPFLLGWFGDPKRKADVVQLSQPGDAPFEAGSALLTSFAGDSRQLEIPLVHGLTHAAFRSARPWIDEGVAHFSQALWREHEAGRQAALDYMGSHRTGIVEAEKAVEKQNSAADHSLVATTDEEFYRSKAMFVWWMLRDMVGEATLEKTLAGYRSEDDQDVDYMQRLIEKASGRDLKWFFDDWVYQDRGLPDFRVVSAYPRATAAGYVVTISIENLGNAGAEVPVTVRAEGGQVTKRLEVRAKAMATTRVEVPSKPQEVIVNDGSVPESRLDNNTLKIEAGNNNR